MATAWGVATMCFRAAEDSRQVNIIKVHANLEFALLARSKSTYTHSLSFFE